MRTTNPDIRRAGELFFVEGAAFLTGTMLAASIPLAYDYHGGAISDLGVIDQTALLFNILLVVVGALNIVAGYLFYGAHRRTRLLAMFVVGGFGAIGAGLLPLSTGAPHSLFALVGFLFFNMEAVATARVITGPVRWISVVAGVVGLVYIAVMVIGDGGNDTVFGAIGHGGAERMIVYPAMLWLLALGGYLMSRSGEVLIGDASPG
jgi:hypothetical membrane protein